MEIKPFSQKILDLSAEAERHLTARFAEMDAVAFRGTQRVLSAFAAHRVSDSLFAGTTGYGYDDKGRDTLDAIYADVFGAEAAFVRHTIANGTQALTIGLFGLLRPGDILLSVTNRPYDTLAEVIGIDKTQNKGNGSLRDFGVEYRQIDLLPDGSVDYNGIASVLDACGDRVKVVFIQRSKGYMNRPTLSAEEIGKIIRTAKAHSKAYVMVDNCYGEFTEDTEPTMFGADLMVGSLIKNPGGGMAECGGYLAGTARAVELCSYRLTSPGVGLEVGATLGNNRSLYKGFFYAPHTVAQALKTAAFAAYLFEALGCTVEPRWDAPRYDIIQTVQCGTKEGLCGFCRGIQGGSPVDAFATPEPYAMPGYNDEVIMAAGAFTQGSSIELSADGPIRPPYTAYLQGGLTYEAGKYGIMRAADEILKSKS